MWPISSRGLYLLCVVIITASTKLFGETFAVWQSKFELSRPSEHRENDWEHFFVTNESNTKKNMNMKKNGKHSRSLNLVHVSPCTLDIHGRYQCVTQLSLSQVMAIFCLIAVAFSCGADNMFSICRNWSKITSHS